MTYKGGHYFSNLDCAILFGFPIQAGYPYHRRIEVSLEKGVSIIVCYGGCTFLEQASQALIRDRN